MSKVQAGWKIEAALKSRLEQYLRECGVSFEEFLTRHLEAAESGVQTIASLDQKVANKRAEFETLSQQVAKLRAEREALSEDLAPIAVRRQHRSNQRGIPRCAQAVIRAIQATVAERVCG